MSKTTTRTPKLKTYSVYCRMVTVAIIKVEATSKADAIDKAHDEPLGKEDLIETTYRAIVQAQAPKPLLKVRDRIFSGAMNPIEEWAHDRALDLCSNVTKRRKPMSTLTPVKSSMIAAIGFTDEPPTIIIQFAKGQTWHYSGPGVTKTLYLSLKASESAGKFFLNNIKGKFQERRVDTKEGGAA